MRRKLASIVFGTSVSIALTLAYFSMGYSEPPKEFSTHPPHSANAKKIISNYSDIEKAGRNLDFDGDGENDRFLQTEKGEIYYEKSSESDRITAQWYRL